MVKLLSERAFAKINLFLRVTGRRADGYHELDSIFVPVSISDRITLEVRPASESSITLRCNIPELGAAKTNLAARAARAFLDEFRISEQVIIDLEKTIPAGAGLGGGSSDAGTVLRMLTSMMRLDDSNAIRERLQKIAVGLGADVPFFLNPRPSRVRGIGEQIEAFEKFPTLHLVIAVPPIEVPTASVFKALKPEGWSGAANESEVQEIVAGKVSVKHLVNDLEAPAMHLYPQIAKLKALLEECGAEAASMSGSGGAVFGLYRDEAAASRGAVSMRESAPEARIFVARSL